MSRVSFLDYAFLAFESDASPKHVAGLQIYDLPEKAPANFIAQLIKKIKSVPPVAPFDRLFHSPLIGFPEWQKDPDFDIDLHVHHVELPSPYSERILLDYVASLHEEKLDRNNPLWELYVLEPYGKRSFALFFKVHHAYMDGISLSKRAVLALSEKPYVDSTFTFWGEQDNRYLQERNSIAAFLSGSAKNAGKALFVLPALAKIGLKHGLRFAKLSGRELPVPFTAPRTAFNEALTPERSVALAKISLARLRSVAYHAGVTVNDVVLELCDSAMTRYLKEHDEIPARPLVAQMPISLRKSEQGRGNQFGIALLELSSKENNPVARLQRIHTHAKHAKDEFTAMSSEAAEIYTLILQSAAQFGELTRLGQFLPPLGNVVVSNVAGPEKQLYLQGAPLRAIYPVSTIAPGLALNITAYSYYKSMHFGIVAGTAAIVDIKPLADFIESSMVELETVMKLGKTRRTRAKRKRNAPVRRKRTVSQE